MGGKGPYLHFECCLRSVGLSSDTHVTNIYLRGKMGKKPVTSCWLDLCSEKPKWCERGGPQYLDITENIAQVI